MICQEKQVVELLVVLDADIFLGASTSLLASEHPKTRIDDEIHRKILVAVLGDCTDKSQSNVCN